jgi:hypothetical protein
MDRRLGKLMKQAAIPIVPPPSKNAACGSFLASAKLRHSRSSRPALRCAAGRAGALAAHGGKSRPGPAVPTGDALSRARRNQDAAGRGAAPAHHGRQNRSGGRRKRRAEGFLKRFSIEWAWFDHLRSPLPAALLALRAAEQTLRLRPQNIEGKQTHAGSAQGGVSVKMEDCCPVKLSGDRHSYFLNCPAF